jgi:cytochrome P450
MTTDEPLSYPFGEPEGLTINPAYETLLERPGMATVQPTFGTTAHLAVRYDDVRCVLGDDRFSRAKSVAEDEPRVHSFIPRPDALNAMDPPEHTRLRRALSSAFTTRKTAAMEPRVQEIADGLLDEMARVGSPADLVAAYAHPLPIMVICELLGVPFEDRHKFSEWANATLSTASATIAHEEIVASRAEMFGYLSGLIEARREEPADDLLSQLVLAHDEHGSLNATELLGLASSVLVAGYETTANQIANCVYVLLSNPDRLTELRDHPELLHNAVEELLRVATVMATAGFSRIATEDVKVGQQLVQAGERVLPALFTANTDPAVFENPHEIDFYRSNSGTHLAFSYGAHHCPGNALARVELRVALGALLKRFPKLSFAHSAKEVLWKEATLSRGPLRLPVAW